MGAEAPEPVVRAPAILDRRHYLDQDVVGFRYLAPARSGLRGFPARINDADITERWEQSEDTFRLGKPVPDNCYLKLVETLIPEDRHNVSRPARGVLRHVSRR